MAKPQGKLFHTPSKKHQNGFASLLILLILSPTVMLFMGGLWLMHQGQAQLASQKNLDQCLFKVISHRCQALSQISKLNRQLRKVQQDLLAAHGIQVKTRLRATATAIAHAQSLVQVLEKSAWSATFACGALKTNLNHVPLQLLRKPNTLSKLTQTPAPIFWKNAWLAGELHLVSWSFSAESYAHCKSVKSQTPALFGQEYAPSFTHANSH